MKIKIEGTLINCDRIARLRKCSDTIPGGEITYYYIQADFGKGFEKIYTHIEKEKRDEMYETIKVGIE